MTLRLEYDLTLTPPTHVDRVVETVRTGLLAHRTNKFAELEMTYRTRSGADGLALSLSVNIELPDFGMMERGAAGLAAFLGGTSFRDPEIRSATLSTFSLSRDDSSFPGPLHGISLLATSAWTSPLLSVPIPKSIARNSWADVSRTLIDSGVQVLTDLSLNLTDNEMASRVAAVSEAADPQRPVAIFLNATTRLEYTLRLAEKIVTTLQPRAPNIRIGVRICPVAMGFSVFEYLRTWNLPIFAYTLTAYPAGHAAWSQAAYASMVNAIGGDIVNVGLLSLTALHRGTLHETIMPLLNKGNLARASLPALTGGIEPRVAYEYARILQHPFVLHTMTPVFRDGIDRKSLRRRVQAIKEAAVAGRQSFNIEELFAARSPIVKNWQEIEEIDSRR
ncbi:hypothetical protein [Herbidospora mongoliensis]|uniref:hypothetical protein n=1 Tax=Herbidospora mongoliensis TaxID=688067 RepID=UPI0012FA1BFF|nr:hypothetical protein [Herbidospora mongoliensis]